MLAQLPVAPRFTVHSFFSSGEHVLLLVCWAGAAGVLVFPSAPEVYVGRKQWRQILFLVPFPCFLSCCDLKCFERVTSVFQRLVPLVAASADTGDVWTRISAKKASFRDWSDYNIRGKHSDLGVASVRQQTFAKSVACKACTFNVPCCSQVAQ